MALDITYNWNFNPLESYPTASGETDVVFLVHWQLYANTGSYVCGWVTSSMASGSVEAMYASLEQQIENQINPPILVQQAPWLNPTSAE